MPCGARLDLGVSGSTRLEANRIGRGSGRQRTHLPVSVLQG